MCCAECGGACAGAARARHAVPCSAEARFRSSSGRRHRARHPALPCAARRRGGMRCSRRQRAGRAVLGPLALVVTVGSWCRARAARNCRHYECRRVRGMRVPLRFPAPSDSSGTRHRTGSMIADAVRYMSVHSWKQPDSHGRSGTSPPQKQQPARRGIPSSRAVSAGSGRCWVRTSVG